MGSIAGCSAVGGPAGGGFTAGIPCGSVGSPGPIGFDIHDRLSPMPRNPATATRLLVVACLLFALSACSGATADRGRELGVPGGPDIEAPADPQEACRITDPRLDELSGLAASTQHPGILWTHNDSGDSARIFALDALTCEVRAEVRLAGVSTRDTEAISVGKDADSQPVLWLGDVGDNAATNSSVRLYRFGEPAQIKDQTIKVQATITVKYFDEPYNAEAMLVQPSAAGRIWIVTKRGSKQGAYYELPKSVWGGSKTVTLRPTGSVPAMTTDATFAPDGRTYAIRTYFGGTQFQGVPPGEDPADLDIGFRGQGEGLTYSYDSRFLYAVSEGADNPLLMIPLP